MNGFEGLALANKDYVAEQYRRWKDDPRSVDESWALFFAGFELAGGRRTAPPALDGRRAPAPRRAPADAGGRRAPVIGVFDLVHSYRELGHLVAHLNPLGAEARRPSAARPSEFGFGDGRPRPRRRLRRSFQGCRRGCRCAS